MTTEQDTKDARQITMVIFMAITAILILAYGWPYIFGQIEVKQSVKTNGYTTAYLSSVITID